MCLAVLTPLDKAHAAYPTVVSTAFVDDIACELAAREEAILEHLNSKVNGFRQNTDDNLGRARDSQSQIVNEDFGDQYACPPCLEQHNATIMTFNSTVAKPEPAVMPLDALMSLE